MHTHFWQGDCVLQDFTCLGQLNCYIGIPAELVERKTDHKVGLTVAPVSQPSGYVTCQNWSITKIAVLLAFEQTVKQGTKSQHTLIFASVRKLEKHVSNSDSFPLNPTEGENNILKRRWKKTRTPSLWDCSSDASWDSVCSTLGKLRPELEIDSASDANGARLVRLGSPGLPSDPQLKA